MGFKLKKKNTGEETVRKASGPGFLAKTTGANRRVCDVYLVKEKNLSHLF